MNVKKPTYKACLLGAALNTGNMGVSALAASVIKLIIDRQPHAKVILVIGNKTAEPQSLFINGENVKISVCNYRLSPRSPLKQQLMWSFFIALLQRIIPINRVKKLLINSVPMLRTINNATFIGDIRGGDSFSDIYGFRRFFIGSIPDIIVILLKKELKLLPQTFGPYKRYITKFFAKFIIKNAKKIISRDKYGIPYLENLILNKNIKVDYCPDVAFTLESFLPDEIEYIKKYDFKSKLPLIGININGLMFNGGYSKRNMFNLELDYRYFINHLVKTLLHNTNANILLIPHTFGSPGNINSDPDACKNVYNGVEIHSKERINMINKEYNQHHIKGIINKCDFFVGSRMHSCIAALSHGIPTIGVAYSKKFLGVFNSLDFDDYVVDARNLEAVDATNKILKLYSNKDFMEALLNQKLVIIHKQINDIFNIIVA